MVSFDVTSLFTQVPIDEALKVVKARRTKDPTLVDRTSIPVPQLVELIELCLRSTYFRFQNNFFEQIDGTPMGSPLSPVIANLFMEDLAEQAMHTSTRCLSTNIQFTIKKEVEGRLAFLDVLMIHSKDQLSTTVYRKPTHTDRYIPYHSHHHPRMLTGVMRGMRDRALRICNNTSRQAEMEHLARVFEANGFPEKLVRKTLTKPQRQ